MSTRGIVGCIPMLIVLIIGMVLAMNAMTTPDLSFDIRMMQLFGSAVLIALGLGMSVTMSYRGASLRIR